MLKFTLDERDKAIAEVICCCGNTINSVLDGSYKNNLNNASHKTLEFMDKFGTVNIKQNGKPLSKRGIQKIIQQFKNDNTVETQVIAYEETGDFKLPPNKTLDDYLSEILMLESTEDFINKCGYKQSLGYLYQEKNNTRGFDSKQRGYFYVIRVFNKDREFIKFGVTHNNPSVRHSQQMSNARRIGLEYQFESIFVSDLCDGSVLLELEYELKQRVKYLKRTKQFRITKQMFPDGHTETLPLSDLSLILNTISNHNIPIKI